MFIPKVTQEQIKEIDWFFRRSHKTQAWLADQIKLDRGRFNQYLNLRLTGGKSEEWIAKAYQFVMNYKEE